MARFLGRIQGSRGPAQRLGGSGGLTTIAASWNGAVRVHLFAKDHEGGTGGEDWCTIEFTKWHGVGKERVLYHGPVGKRRRR